jgi:protocatechuate 3,4-dioxygenase beta subunit
VDTACAPVAGAAVEIWHTDAAGDYSAFIDGGGGKDEGPGTTFMRGTQFANDEGIVEFDTVYPGWYRGRSVHIHLRVRTDDTLVLTSQIYFDDTYTQRISTEPPYAEFGPPDTTNDTDFLAGDPAAEGTLLTLSDVATPRGPGTLGRLNLRIHT